MPESRRQFNLDISPYECVDVPHSHAAAAKAVELVREGRAEALMKGSLHTDELMGAVVQRETGLRTDAAHQPLLRHGRAGPRPGADHHRRGGEHLPRRSRTRSTSSRTRSTSRTRWVAESPKVAILSAMETVNPECPLHDRGRGAVQDGRPRTDHGRHPRWPAGARQRDQPRGGEDQEDRFAGRRAGERARRARPRGGQHARQEPHRSWRTPTRPESCSGPACRSSSPAAPTR